MATANLYTTEAEIVNGVLTTTAVYKVKDANNEREALFAEGLPRFRYQHPTITRLRVASVRARLNTPEEDRKNWLVTVGYTPYGEPVGSGSNKRRSSTGLPENTIAFRNEIYSMPFEVAFSDLNLGRVPDVQVCNTLQERPDPPLQIPSRHLVLVGTCYYLNPNIPVLMSLQGTTNDAAITLGGVEIPLHGAVMRSVQPDYIKLYDSEGVPSEDNSWAFTFEIVLTPAFKEFWNMSVNMMLPDLSGIVPIRDAEENPVVEPQHIDEQGIRQEVPVPLLLSFRYAPQANWAGLGIPEDLPVPQDADDLFDDPDDLL